MCGYLHIEGIKNPDISQLVNSFKYVIRHLSHHRGYLTQDEHPMVFDFLPMPENPRLQ